MLYHRCTAGAHSLGSSAKNWCAFARALLLYPHRGAGCAWRNTHANCHWLVLLTLEGDWALRRDPISQSLWRYVSVPSFRRCRRCPIAVVLSFLQDGLERRLSPSTLKVYVAAIAAHHDAVDGKSLGKHDLVVRFLRGARRLNPPRPHLVPSWDLPSVLSALRGAPFEPLQSVELKFLSLKTVLLSALATVKRVGDLQAFSVDDSCLEFGPADSRCPETPAWICAQSSHHALQGPGGELASAAPGGGRPSHCSALSRSCLAHLCGPHAELQDLRPALCLLRRTAEGKSCLQTKTRPLDSGGYSLGLSGPALTVPPWCESTLYERRCFLLGFGTRRLNSRHL